MGTKKDIGSQVKKALDGHTVSPDNAVWEKLEDALKERNKKRRFFFIWLSSGLASLLVLLFILFNNNIIPNSKNNNSIFDTSISESSSSESILENSSKKIDDKSKHNNSAYTNNEILDLDANSDNSNSKYVNAKPQENSENSINNNPDPITIKSDGAYIKSSTNIVEGTKNSLHKKSNSKNYKRSNSRNTAKNSKAGSITTNDYSEKNNTEQPQNPKTPALVGYAITSNSSSETKSSSNLNSEREAVTPKSIAISDLKKSSKNERLSEQVNVASSTKKSNIEAEKSQKNLDSTLTNAEKIAENKKTKKNEKVKKEEKKTPNRWSVFPHVSVDFYGSFNNTFPKNASTNYGLYLGYEMSEKVTLRLGVNRLKLNFNKEVNNMEEGAELTYTEFPIEVKYKIMDNKIRTSVLFGFSHLSLDEVRIKPDLNMPSNLDVLRESNYSFNVGFSFQKKLSKKLYLNLEPNFKYHLNPTLKKSIFTISNTSVLFGVEYKF